MRHRRHHAHPGVERGRINSLMVPRQNWGIAHHSLSFCAWSDGNAVTTNLSQVCGAANDNQVTAKLVSLEER